MGRCRFAVAGHADQPSRPRAALPSGKRNSSSTGGLSRSSRLPRQTLCRTCVGSGTLEDVVERGSDLASHRSRDVLLCHPKSASGARASKTGYQRPSAERRGNRLCQPGPAIPAIRGPLGRAGAASTRLPLNSQALVGSRNFLIRIEPAPWANFAPMMRFCRRQGRFVQGRGHSGDYCIFHVVPVVGVFPPPPPPGATTTEKRVRPRRPCVHSYTPRTV